MSTNYGGGAPLSYNKYLRVPELVNLQTCLSHPVRHDELLFITIHQTYELWFKQILHEIDSALSHLDEGKLAHAERSLKRCIEIERVLVNQIHVLETMTPYHFLEFRDELKPASGFQSTQFKEIEFVSGAKDEKLLKFFEDDTFAYELLTKRLESRTLHDAFFDLLKREGWLTESSYEGRVAAVVKLLKSCDEYSVLFSLSERLIEHDEQISLWRSHHVLMVERMLGAKPGTGGSEGIGYLRQTLSKRFFPELWEARTYLEVEA